ncbi:TetR family transcriptional regulator [Arthrobacter zhaoguopingii]|uniref:TetR/AcrR family transcriptional regulator n=1 Tax=Arthrobacter zhaoguopingii TaxID=2681491 RepID=UPI00135802AA|nr:TetR family transcriptional regulator [Arthrobacter zhaoguopingii]
MPTPPRPPLNPSPPARPGRRPGVSETRESILAAARRQFAEGGFAKTSVRGVAKEAGVDPGLVRHYFGSKEDLLREVISIPVDASALIRQIVEGPRDAAGSVLAAAIAGILADDEKSAVITALVRTAATEPEGARMVRDAVSRTVITPLAMALQSDQAELRGALTASQTIGFFVAHRIVRLEPLQGLDRQTVVALLGPTLQRYLTGPLP